MKELDRRRFLSLLATGAATPFLVTMSGCGGGSRGDDEPLDSGNDPIHDTTQTDFPSADNEEADAVFSLSIASGDPSPTGVVLWTRIDPSAVVENQPLYVEVAQDGDFNEVILGLTVLPEDINVGRDYTVSIDLDGRLFSNRRYYYRFIYGETSSRTGRCRTAPALDADIDTLKMAVISCQDYTNGYYGAFNALANDDTIDFILHLGDFIYETAGDESFQSLPFQDRLIQLSSLNFPGINVSVAMDLEDYRNLYRIYRSDPFLQRAMEAHTWIVTRDDHETAEDAYWDYANETVGLPNHPYTLDSQFEANRLQLLNQLMLDSQQSWLEYVPVRAITDESSTNPLTRLQYYRHIRFGNLVDLFMLDGRTYRTGPKCVAGDMSTRFFPEPSCNDWFDDQTQSLLGETQREWLLTRMAESRTTWQVLGNQTAMSPLWTGSGGSKENQTPLNVDSWDGFDYERSLLASEIQAAGITDLVVLTGDLHTFIVSHIKKDYLDNDPNNFLNYVGVEFMTSSVTSVGLTELSGNVVDGAGTVDPLLQTLLISTSSLFIRGENPHLEYFNSTAHGYCTVEFNGIQADWSLYQIDKDVNDGNQTPTLLAKFRKHRGRHIVERLSIES